MTTRYSCKDCRNYKKCTMPCIYVEMLANGNTSRREPLASDIFDESYESNIDYNSSLAELIEHCNVKLSYIMSQKCLRRRAILAMVACQIPRDTIAEFLEMSPRHLARIINQNK